MVLDFMVPAGTQQRSEKLEKYPGLAMKAQG
jgi:hypothetical protein